MTNVLRDELGICIRRIEDAVEAQLATPEVATLLQTELMTPIPYFTGTTFDDHNEVVDIACISYRGDIVAASQPKRVRFSPKVWA